MIKCGEMMIDFVADILSLPIRSTASTE